MIPFVDSVLAGLVICIPFTIVVFVTFSTIPRVWLHSLPADIARMAGFKTPREEQITRWVMMPLVLAIPGTDGAAGWKDIGFHFRALVKALAMTAVFAAPAAAAVAWAT